MADGPFSYAHPNTGRTQVTLKDQFFLSEKIVLKIKVILSL